MIRLKSRFLSLFLKSFVSVYLVLYLLTISSCLEKDILNTKMWQKRNAAFVVFDARKTFSVFFQSVLAPGMRSSLSNCLWIVVHDLWQQRRWYKIPEYLEMITILQPEYLDAWEMSAWHLGYNVTFLIEGVDTLSEEKKEKEIAWWTEKAVNVLKSGIIINNDTYRLYFVLGWMYYHRIHDYDNAIKYLTIAKRFPDHIPFVERNIVYCYEKKGEKKKALELLLDLRNDENYYKNDSLTTLFIDRNIERIREELEKK